jgi:hypothetical protein
VLVQWQDVPAPGRLSLGETRGLVSRDALIGFRGSYDLALSEKRNSFLRLLKNKGFKEERTAKVGLYAIR